MRGGGEILKESWEEKKRRQDYEAMLKGMSRAAKHWSRMGAQKRREGFYPLGLKKASEWFNEGKLFFDDLEENNKRKAHCKICAKELKKGVGHRVLIYASNWYNLSFYFGCNECKNKLEGLTRSVLLNMEQVTGAKIPAQGGQGRRNEKNENSATTKRTLPD